MCGQTHIGDDLSGAARADVFLPTKEKKKKSTVGRLRGAACVAGGEGYERALEIGEDGVEARPHRLCAVVAVVLGSVRSRLGSRLLVGPAAGRGSLRPTRLLTRK